MSLQDESFPHDEFFDELNYSLKPNRPYQFPHAKREQRDLGKNTSPTPTTKVSSLSFTNESQNISNESENGPGILETSPKTSLSDPTGLEDYSKKSNFSHVHSYNKAVSYQDIHSAYTKRRYKHVQSKVGQYIANLKAEEEKRRSSNKFQRHQSLPETLTSACAVVVDFGNNNNKCQAHRFSDNALHVMNESLIGSDGVEIEVESSSENVTRMTSSHGSASSSYGTHESSADDGTTAVCGFVDKMAYGQLLNENERIQSFSDYLQTKLDEKISENIRLKRNVDFMRIELSNCQDKLKRYAAGQMAMSSLSLGAMPGRQSLHSLLYCKARNTKATQTEVLVETPVLCDTPETSDANNNALERAIDGKRDENVELCTATLLSNSDSTIDTDSAEATLPLSPDVRKVHSSPVPLRRQLCAGTVGCYATLETSNVSSSFCNVPQTTNNMYPGGDVSSTSVQVAAHAAGKTLNNAGRKKNSFRRWLSLLGPCARCQDVNHPNLDNSTVIVLQQTYTQIPLLEESHENHCRNTR